jgi:allophanate hydrolase subunit 2
MIIPVDGNRKIEVAGQPVRLVDRPTPVDRVDLRAAGGNTTDIFLGGRHIKSTIGDLRGHRLQTDDVLTLENTDLYEWWVVGETKGDYPYWGGERDE